MQNLELYIGNQRLTLFDDETVSLTQTIQNVKDIGSVFTDFTQTFNLPANSINNKEFKHYYNFNIVDGFNANIKAPASIYLNSVLFRKGFIALDGVALKNNRPDTYKIVFFGETVDLKKKLNEVTLQDVFETTTDFDHNYNVANVKLGLEGNTLLSNNAIVYPLVSHTERFFYNASANVQDTRNLYFNGSGTGVGNHGVKYTDLKPAIKLSSVLDRIETYTAETFDTGLVFERTGKSFFNIDNADDNYNELYDKMFLWLSREKGLLGENYLGSEVYRIPITSMTEPAVGWDQGSPFCYDYGSAVGIACNNSRIIGGIWRIKTIDNNNGDNDKVYFSTNFRVTGSGGGTFTISIENITSGTIVSSSSGLDADGSTEYSISGLNLGNTSTYTEFRYVVTATSDSFSYSAEIDFIKREVQDNRVDPPVTTVSVSTVTNVGPTGALQRIVVSDQMPDLLVLDYLTGLFKMFNLTAFFQTDGKIMVQTLDSYYAGGNNYDISEYIDISESSVDFAPPYQEIAFRNVEQKTFLAVNFEEINNETFGDLENSTTVSGINQTDRGSKYVIQTPFEKMLFERLTDTTIQYGYSVDKDQQPINPDPLLFVNVPTTSSNNPISFIDGASSGQANSITSYNRPSNSSTLNTINFNSEIDEFTLEVKSNSLFQNNYFNYISGVFNPKRRMTMLTAYLPLKILLKYSLADTFIINGNSYNINSITTNLQSGKSELQLFNKIIIAESALANTLQNELQYEL
jgi:hypothetical protein